MVTENNSWFTDNTITVTVTYVDGRPSVSGSIKNARVDAGASFIANQVFNTAAAGTPFRYLSLAPTQITPVKTDTTLVGELTTNGLARASASISAPTVPSALNGTTTITLTNTFTYSGTGAQNIGSIAVFNAASGGTMGFEAALGQLYTVFNSGDQITITYQFNF